MAERGWDDSEAGGGVCLCLDMTLVETGSPSLFSGTLWEEREALREAGAGQSCPLRWKLSPGLSLGLPKPVSDCPLVIPSCVALGDSFCFWSLGFPLLVSGGLFSVRKNPNELFGPPSIRVHTLRRCFEDLWICCPGRA